MKTLKRPPPLPIAASTSGAVSAHADHAATARANADQERQAQ
jgi:hypothetical protein